MNMRALLVINILFALVWALLTGTQEPYNYVVGFGVGFGVLTFSSRAYGRRIGRAAAFGFYVLWQIVLSALHVSQAILRPGRHVRPGIVAVPLDASTPFEILLLATVITLTPGTISVETGTTVAGDSGSTGRRVLFVHALTLDDPESLAASIKHDFERRILSFTRAESPEAGAGAEG